MKKTTESKILQLVCEMTQEQGGPTFSSLNLAIYLSEVNNKLIVIGNADAHVQKELLQNRIDFELIKSTFGNKSGLCLTGFSRLIKEIIDHDVIIVHGFYTFTTLVSCLFTRKKNIYICPHGSLESYQWGESRFKKFIFDTLFRLRLNSNSISFAVATDQEVISVKKKFANKVEVVGIGIDIPQEAFAKKHIPLNNLNLFSVSRIAKKKRIDISIQTVSILKKMNFEVNLWIYGDGERKLVETLKKLSSELGVSDKVHFEGSVSHDFLEEIYKTRGIFLLPSENENFAISVAESIGFQTPVVISRHVALSSFVENNACGEVITNLDPSELATAILHVHTNYEAYEEACNLSRNRLSHQIVRDAWFSLLKLDEEI